MRIERNLKLIDGYNIGMNLVFILPVGILYYRDEIGIGFHEFLIGEAFFAATIIALDVPAGWISDVWQRKRALAVGIFFQILGYSILALATSFFMAVAAQMTIGVGLSLCNGTNTAILYDSLLSRGREGEYRRREGRRLALCLYMVATGCVIGGLTYSINHHLPLALGLIALCGALICACLIDEPERHKRRPERHPVMDVLATIKYAVHGHAEIAFIILSAAILFSGTKILMWSQQPYYMALGVPEAWFGALIAVGAALGGFSSHIAHKLDGRIEARRALMYIWIAAVAICLGAGAHVGWFGVILLMLGGSCIYGLTSPRINEVINNNVDSSRRATVLSTQTMMVSALFIPVSSVMGYISKHWDIQTMLLAMAVWLGVAKILLELLPARRKL